MPIRREGGGFRAEIDVDRVTRALERFPDEMAQASGVEFRRAGERWVRRMQLRFGKKGALKSREGALRNSIRSKTQTGSSLEDVVTLLIAGSSAAPYAAAQEFGAVIRPKKKGALTVPLEDALTPAGRLRGEARIRPNKTVDLGPSFLFYPKSGGDAMIVARVDGKLQFLYVLKDEVTLPGPKTTGIPSRLGALDTAESVAKGLASLLGKRAKKILEKGGD